MKTSFATFGLFFASFTFAAPRFDHETTDISPISATSFSTQIRPSAFPTRSPREDIDLHPLDGFPFDAPGPVIPTSIPAATTKSNPIPVPAIIRRTTLELTTEQKLNHFARVLQLSLAGPASAVYCANPFHRWEETCTERFEANLTAIAGVRIASFYATGMMLADFSLAERVLQRIRKEQKKQTDDTLVKLYAEVLDCAKTAMDHLRKSVAEFTAKSAPPESGDGKTEGAPEEEKADGGSDGEETDEAPGGEEADGTVLVARGHEPKDDSSERAAEEDEDEQALANGGW